jgi:16S rRNA (cytosine1402-N4)-methyltransferase
MSGHHVSIHVPVLPREVIEQLDPRPGQIIVDGTLGGGGHTRMFAERVGPTGLIIALDRDPTAIDAAERSLAGLPIKLAQANYCELPDLLEQLEISAVNAVLLDLGLSSDQLADRERGFSFDTNGSLDLRFDPSAGEPAWRLIERLEAERLADLIFKFGEERHSRRIARKIVEARLQEPIRTAGRLAEIVRRAVPRTRDSERIHPATRTFQALRIAVNDELGSLEKILKSLPDCLSPGGRAAIISFHSLEDRRVKEAFRDDPRWQSLARKPIVASEAEIAQNPRARSAKLRVAQRA